MYFCTPHLYLKLNKFKKYTHKFSYFSYVRTFLILFNNYSRLCGKFAKKLNQCCTTINYEYKYITQKLVPNYYFLLNKRLFYC